MPVEVILEIFLYQKRLSGNIWRKAFYQNFIYNSPWNNLQIKTSVLKYLQKYGRSRRHLSRRSSVMKEFKCFMGTTAMNGLGGWCRNERVNPCATKWCDKTGKWLKPWQIGTQPRVLSESYLINITMTGFRWFSKLFASLCFEWK